jgi:single-stranded-DNA-specific exonuclease
MKKWTVKTHDVEIAAPVVAGVGALARDTLIVRGIIDVEQAHEFFNAEKLNDPFLMKDMKKAVTLINETLEQGGKIVIYGDYDCDGITSTVMLHNHLLALGGEVDWYIPSRDEGYGLHAAAIEKLAVDETALIITVDTGITAVAESVLIKEKGIRLIITDHHSCPEVLPEADAILNPRQSGCEYPFKQLAGCGVVLKLIAALEDGDCGGAIEQYGELAAIGTIGDVVELVGENRQIVCEGLKNLEFSENIGLRCLMSNAGLSFSDRIPDAMSIAFKICPRINAAGRMTHARAAVELLLCENRELAAAKAEELSRLNEQRKEEEKRITAEIGAHLGENPALLNERLLVLVGSGWHHGIIGIVASKLTERYGKPCIVISDGKGSCRSIAGFSIIEALRHCSELLTKFGGHSGAAGLTAEESRLAELTAGLHEYAALNPVPAAETIADCQPFVGDITVENVKKLDSLQPFGAGNPAPVFHLSNCRIKYKRPLKDGLYTSFNIECCGMEFKVVDFSRRYVDFWYKVGDTVDLMLCFSINEYNNTEEVSMRLEDIRLSGITKIQERYFAARDVYEKLQRGEKIDKKLLPRIIPDENSHAKTAYNLIKGVFCSDEVVQRGLLAGMNYCMLRVIIDVFAEMGLAEYNPAAGDIKTLPVKQKVDLGQSKLLMKLKELNHE